MFKLLRFGGYFPFIINFDDSEAENWLDSVGLLSATHTVHSYFSAMITAVFCFNNKTKRCATCCDTVTLCYGKFGASYIPVTVLHYSSLTSGI